MPGFSINVATQSGNLTRDPELRSLPSGTAVCNLGIAVNERFKDEAGNWGDRAHFFNWTVWGGLGEWVANNMRKGDGLTISGRARWHDWEDKDGNKRSAVDFTADGIVPQRSGDGGGERAQRQREQAEGADFQARDTGFTARSDVTPPDAGNEFAAGAPAQTAAQTPADDDIPFKWIPVEWEDGRVHDARW